MLTNSGCCPLGSVSSNSAGGVRQLLWFASVVPLFAIAAVLNASLKAVASLLAGATSPPDLSGAVIVLLVVETMHSLQRRVSSLNFGFS